MMKVPKTELRRLLGFVLRSRELVISDLLDDLIIEEDMEEFSVGLTVDWLTIADDPMLSLKCCDWVKLML